MSVRAGEILTPLGVSCILSGNILILRWGILRLSGISSPASADGRATLLGKSIADSFMVASLSWGELPLLTYSAGSESTLAIFFR